ncbi:MAG: molybdenum cofactor guanylyltransferase [Bacteroidetes bacterium]|nr:molybdenum cofactor guanylyltransferase [Bacteroidota bacterium]
MYNDITGIILAGGKSSRMGVNKSFLKLGSQTIIERITDLMKSIFTEVIIITNTPEEYLFLQLPLHEDIFKGQGPLGGIHSGLTHSKTGKNFVISCDIPLMTQEVIEFLTGYSTDRPITVARADGFIQQLCGVYCRSLLNEIEKIIFQSETEIRNNEQTKRKCSVHKLIENVNAEIIDIENDYSTFWKETFFNMNQPEDYVAIKRKLSSNK